LPWGISCLRTEIHCKLPHNISLLACVRHARSLIATMGEVARAQCPDDKNTSRRELDCWTADWPDQIELETESSARTMRDTFVLYLWLYNFDKLTCLDPRQGPNKSSPNRRIVGHLRCEMSQPKPQSMGFVIQRIKNDSRLVVRSIQHRHQVASCSCCSAAAVYNSVVESNQGVQDRTALARQTTRHGRQRRGTACKMTLVPYAPDSEPYAIEP
jgi:hypothetical protein